MTVVAYIGNHVPPFGTEQQVGYGFERAGCRVIRVQEQDAHERGAAALAEEWAREGVDLCAYTRTHNQSALAYGWTAADPWAPIRDAGIVTATVHLDVFVGLAREHFLVDRDPMFTVDHCFTADGSPEAARAMRDHGFRHHWLVPAVDERVLERTASMVARDGGPHHLESGPLREAPPIVFVGSRYGYHREDEWRPQMFAALESRYGPRFAWYGNGSSLGTLRGPDLDALYASDRVIVGTSCFAGRRERYFSDRIPETLGRGGFLLHHDLGGAGGYEHGEHYVAYTATPDGLIAQIDATLAMDPEARARIKRAGRSLVSERHLWRHRAVQILETCGLADRVADAR